MTATQIKKHLHETPFRPFSLVTADGRKFPVPHEDYVSIDPTGRTLIVWERTGGAGSVLDVRLVIRLDIPKPPTARRGRKRAEPPPDANK